MPLESTILCLDNSEWMRNGDYIPNRMEAQHDAANMLCGAKIQSNPESTVGVLSMAGKSVEVLVSPTEDMGKLLNSFHNIPLGGHCQLSNALHVAQLALKHRINKKGSQRVIVFVGSPVEEDPKQLTKVGKLLKKNNIGVDVVSFGDVPSNNDKLQALVDAANSNTNSHLVTIPTGVLLSDVLVTSPVVNGGEGGSGMGSGGGSSGVGGGDFSDYGGVDPSMDPELALALRVSMEEERARQERESKRKAEAEAETAPPSTAATSGPDAMTDDDDALQQALAMSMDSSAAEGKGQSSSAEQTKKAEGKSSSQAPPPPAPASNSAAFLDPTFVNSLLSGLPGVNPNDPKIQAAMKQISEKKSGEDGDDKKSDKKDGDGK